MSHKGTLRFLGIAIDCYGRITGRVYCENDLLLRNWVGILKQNVCNQTLIAADNVKDVNGNVITTAGGAGAIPYAILGSGVNVETNADFRLQAPLYTQPDTCSIGVATLGGGNQVTLAITSSHTFASATGVTEAGFLQARGSTVTYLTNNNIQLSHNVFANVPISAGGTFTSTYTITDN